MDLELKIFLLCSKIKIQFCNFGSVVLKYSEIPGLK